MYKHVQVKISGQVQGVFFRANTQKIAQSLGLKGFVKNEPDGGILIIAEGEQEKLEELVKWCHQGPSRAMVEKIDISWQEPKQKFKNFEIKYNS